MEPIFGVKSISSLVKNIWNALPTEYTHQTWTSFLGDKGTPICVHTLTLFDLMSCLGFAWDEGQRGSPCKGHSAILKWAPVLLLQMGFLSNQEEQSLVPLFTNAS